MARGSWWAVRNELRVYDRFTVPARASLEGLRRTDQGVAFGGVKRVEKACWWELAFMGGGLELESYGRWRLWLRVAANYLCRT